MYVMDVQRNDFINILPYVDGPQDLFKGRIKRGGKWNTVRMDKNGKKRRLKCDRRRRDIKVNRKKLIEELKGRFSEAKRSYCKEYKKEIRERRLLLKIYKCFKKE